MSFGNQLFYLCLSVAKSISNVVGDSMGQMFTLLILRIPRSLRRGKGERPFALATYKSDKNV